MSDAKQCDGCGETSIDPVRSAEVGREWIQKCGFDWTCEECEKNEENVVRS